MEDAGDAAELCLQLHNPDILILDLPIHFGEPAVILPISCCFSRLPQPHNLLTEHIDGIPGLYLLPVPLLLNRHTPDFELPDHTPHLLHFSLHPLGLLVGSTSCYLLLEIVDDRILHYDLVVEVLDLPFVLFLSLLVLRQEPVVFVAVVRLGVVL